MSAMIWTELKTVRIQPKKLLYEAERDHDVYVNDLILQWRLPVDNCICKLVKTPGVVLEGCTVLLLNSRYFTSTAVRVDVHQTAGQNHREHYQLHLYCLHRL